MSRFDATNRRLVVTGVGFREESPEGTSSIFKIPSAKPNIGAAVALEAAIAGYPVSLIARTESRLDRVRESILAELPSATIDVCALDLLDGEAVKRFANSLDASREVDIVHCAGLSAGNYALKNDNPFLPIEEIPIELPTLEFESVVKTFLNVVHGFLPRWKKQKRSRVVVVSSMTAVRAVPFGFSHASAKGALHQAVRSLTLELNPLGIHVCEVMPGIVNTGFYDPPAVVEIVQRIGKAFGYDYGSRSIPQMEPAAVAEAAVLCLRSNAHVLSVNLVAEGQFPHLGA